MNVEVVLRVFFMLGEVITDKVKGRGVALFPICQPCFLYILWSFTFNCVSTMNYAQSAFITNLKKNIM